MPEFSLLYAGNGWDRSLEPLGDDARLDAATRVVARKPVLAGRSLTGGRSVSDAPARL
jgi:hypothetical protein